MSGFWPISDENPDVLSGFSPKSGQIRPNPAKSGQIRPNPAILEPAMAPRYKGGCRFCPKPAPQNKVALLKPTPDTSKMTVVISTPGEGERLWKHVLFGTSTCVSMIEGYVNLGMPGDPHDALVALRDRICVLISQTEKTNANNHSASAAQRETRLERASSDDPDGAIRVGVLEDSQDGSDRSPRGSD